MKYIAWRKNVRSHKIKREQLLIVLANQEDAHMWRYKMLRHCRPRLHSDGKIEDLDRWTVKRIAKVSSQRASYFVTTSARHLFRSDTSDWASNEMEMLSDIYTEGATLSYELWTQRATIRCTTLREMGRPTFDPKSPEQEPHPSVKHDESDDDHLAGRPITVIVHPLLEAYGTNEEAESEFEGYDKGRVLAPAQV
jgi:hypothetical protein